MAQFDYFVVFAEMRTGSNFLEVNLNAFDGLNCFGEAFNQHFIGYPNSKNILGVTQKMRDTDPDPLIDTIRNFSDGLGGFRFFNDHDSRALKIFLPDPRCAKIILTRNPVDSYVSWKIAVATGQWKLTNVKHARAEKVVFKPREFEKHLADLQAFQVHLQNALQKSGQTAFYLDYEDIQDVEVMNGLAGFLGCSDRIEKLDSKLKRQNPQPVSEKVSNFKDMQSALAGLDRFNLSRTPSFEPRRGPMVPTYVAAPESGLLYLPLRSGPEAAIRSWLSALDDASESSLIEGFNQKSLRQWKRAHPGFRSFTVLRHPLARAHAAFCTCILNTGEGGYADIRQTLRQQYKLPLPKDESSAKYDSKAHHTAFLAFLKFLKSNLSGQTNIRVDAAWASQHAVLQGIAGFGLPDMLVREDRLAEDLAVLASQIGKDVMPVVPAQTDPNKTKLTEIYDAEIEAAARDVYQRDYLSFGFGPWQD